MDIYESEYRKFLENGDNARQKAECAYENNDYQTAVINYYHACLAYEQAKVIAEDHLSIQLRIFASEKEYYALQKLDELKRFKGVCTDEVVK